MIPEPPIKKNKLKSLASIIIGGFIKDLLFVKRASLIALIIFAFLYISFVSLLYQDQEKLIFIPSKEFPESLKLDGYQVSPIEFNWEDGVAHGFHYKLESSNKVLLFYYGNAQSVLKTIDRAIWFSKTFKTSIIVVDYPGYGKTSGKPGQDSIDRWLKGYDQYLQHELNYDKSQRLIWGLSLGGGVAARMAQFHGCHSLILESTFSSLTELTSQLYPIVPVFWLLKHPFPTLDTLKNNFSSPVFLIHSKEDKIVDISHAYKMEKDAGWPLLVIQGGHSSGYRKYREQIEGFISPQLKDWLR